MWICNSEEEMPRCLILQNATHISHVIRKDECKESPTDFVVITFNSTPPEKVKMSAMCFRVEHFYPSPYICNKFYCLGDFKSRCLLLSIVAATVVVDMTSQSSAQLDP